MKIEQQGKLPRYFPLSKCLQGKREFNLHGLLHVFFPGKANYCSMWCFLKCNSEQFMNSVKTANSPETTGHEMTVSEDFWTQLARVTS